MIWRWDQGRLEYFQFDSIRQISSVLLEMEGVPTGRAEGDPLREVLEQKTNFPFSPSTYSVWRNYGRVFGLQLLATQFDQKLVCTNLCKFIATEPNKISSDEYLIFVAQRFYYPSPVFQGYDPDAARMYPFCALLKFLTATSLTGGTRIALVDVFSRLIGNDLTGTEPIEDYVGLKATRRMPQGDEHRQVRELMIFFSQLSFLKWESPHLLLDVAKVTRELLPRVEQIATPVQGKRNPDRSLEIIALGNPNGMPFTAPFIERRTESEDQEFIEGKKVRVLHLRSERSRVLRELYFRIAVPPYLCDMCRSDLHLRYPWTERFLEIHHVLPLGSPVHVEHGRTSLKDLVGICPNCHRATHRYYKSWLEQNELNDFRSYDEARAVYNEAKEQVVI